MTSPGAEARVATRSVPVEEALDRAAELLARARSPFVYGLAGSPVGTARLAARLAARAGAAIDVEGGDLLAPEIEAIVTTGQVTATFREILAAADCFVLWRMILPDGAPGWPSSGTGSDWRKFIFVPPAEDAPARGPRRATAGEDLVVAVPEGRDLEALQSLRSLLNGVPSLTSGDGPENALQDRGALPHAALRDAAAAILQARQVVVLWDAALPARGHDGAHRVRALAAGFALLTLDKRRRPRIAARAIGGPGHVAGAMAGLLSATGFPRAVAFRGGAARCDPDRFGAARMLSGGADLVIAIEPLGRPPCPVASSILLIASRRPEGWPEPAVFLPIAPPSRRAGLWLEADGVPSETSPLGDAGRRAASDATESPAGPMTETGALTALPNENEALHALLDRLP